MKTDAANDDAPPGEAEKVERIKHLCWMAKQSAKNIIGLSDEQLKDEGINANEYERYKKLLGQAADLAREITDQFYRQAALHQLIIPLMAAGHEAQAKRLFSMVEVEVIQRAVLKEFPRLGVFRWTGL